MEGDINLIIGLKENNKEVVKALFSEYHTALLKISFRYTRNREISEDMVQDLFINLWQIRHTFNIHTSIQSYLFVSIKNLSIDYLRRILGKQFMEMNESSGSNYNNIEEAINYADLNTIVANGIEKLPPKCKIIFLLIKNEHMSYKEVSEHLKISINTVEAQMRIAVIRLRDFVKSRWCI